MKREAYSTCKNKSWQSCGIAMQRTVSCNSRQMWTLTIFTPNLLCMVTTYRCHTLHSTTGFLGSQYLAECLAKSKQADNKHILNGIADFWCLAAGGIVRWRELSNAQRWIQEMTVVHPDDVKFMFLKNQTPTTLRHDVVGKPWEKPRL